MGGASFGRCGQYLGGSVSATAAFDLITPFSSKGVIRPGDASPLPPQLPRTSLLDRDPLVRLPDLPGTETTIKGRVALLKDESRRNERKIKQGF